MAEDPWRYIGVDWDTGSWVTVGITAAGRLQAGVYESIAKFWRYHGEGAKKIVVDVPVGLCESRHAPAGCVSDDGELSRRCDDLARRVLGPRSSSVFTPPCREAARLAAEGAEYAKINEINRERTGKGLMRQSANIAPGIIEVEELLLADGDPDIIVEGHPEVCFRAFADEPLQYSKRTAPGMVERLTALEGLSEYPKGAWRQLAAQLGEKGYAAGIDDLLDALVLAYTAVGSPSELQSLPQDPPTDSKDLPLQMVYRRPEPFECT